MSIKKTISIMAALPAGLYLLFVVAFNALFFQAAPDGALVSIIEKHIRSSKDFERIQFGKKIDFCQNPIAGEMGNCRIVRTIYPYKNLCGWLNNLLKHSVNCVEMFVQANTPDWVIKKIVQVTEEPCRFADLYEDRKMVGILLRCEKGRDYRHLTSYVVKSHLKGDSFFYASKNELFEKPLSIVTTRRTRRWQFI